VHFSWPLVSYKTWSRVLCLRTIRPHTETPSHTTFRIFCISHLQPPAILMAPLAAATHLPSRGMRTVELGWMRLSSAGNEGAQRVFNTSGPNVRWRFYGLCHAIAHSHEQFKSKVEVLLSIGSFLFLENIPL
jgi:hypothetical protein